MKTILILILASLILAAPSADAQALRLRRRRKAKPQSRLLGEKTLKLTKIAESSLKGGAGKIKFYSGPDGLIVAKASVKKGNAGLLEKVQTKRKPEPVEVFEMLTGKAAREELKDAAEGIRRLAEKKKAKDSEGDHVMERADIDAPWPNLACGPFWEAARCFQEVKRVCECLRNTNRFGAFPKTDYMFSLMELISGNTVTHSIWIRTASTRPYVRAAVATASAISVFYDALWTWYPSSIDMQPRVTDVDSSDRYNWSYKWD